MVEAKYFCFPVSLLSPDNTSTLISKKFYSQQLSKIYDPLLETQRVAGVAQSVTMQLPSTEDGEGFLQNIW